MIKKCPGCGATMQYSDSQKVGYSPKKDAKLCERCFKLKNYNEKKIIELKYNNDDIVVCVTSGINIVSFINKAYNLQSSNDAPFLGITSCCPIIFDYKK